MSCSGCRAISPTYGCWCLRLPHLLCLLSCHSLFHLGRLVSRASSSRWLDGFRGRFARRHHLLLASSLIISLWWSWWLFWVPCLVATMKRLLTKLLWWSIIWSACLIVRSIWRTILSLLGHFTFRWPHLSDWIFSGLGVLSEKLAHWLVLSLVRRLDDWRLFHIRCHLCLGGHAIVSVIGVSRSLHLGWEIGGQIFMS